MERMGAGIGVTNSHIELSTLVGINWHDLNEIEKKTSESCFFKPVESSILLLLIPTILF